MGDPPVTMVVLLLKWSTDLDDMGLPADLGHLHASIYGIFTIVVNHTQTYIKSHWTMVKT